MNRFKIKTHQFYRKSEIDIDYLMATLPDGVKIVSSEEEERNDIIKLEFDRVNCFPLSEFISYSETIIFRLQHGQVFTLIEKLIFLIEKLNYENGKINQYHIWLIFNQENNQKLELFKRSILDYKLFYSFPLLNKNKEDKIQIIELITQIFKFCQDIPQAFHFFESNKPYKIYEKELQQGFQQFKYKFIDYCQNIKNIDQKTQVDLNIDVSDELVQNPDDLKKVDQFIQFYIKQKHDLTSLEAILTELFKQYQLEKGFLSLGMHKKQNVSNYKLDELKKIFEFKQEQQLINLIQETFESLNQTQDILKNSIKYEEYPLNSYELKDLYESAAIIYFKHQGQFNSFDLFIQIVEQINKKQLIFENKFFYIIKPIISEYYYSIMELQVLELISELI
ncbi:unnamed protein product (macronuclear) [Paramecium tetraurelia]|uniref:Uncharacterized protein n=1 Tax=Paramecium tetraurelia TaxID=5888 RepID=A0CT91_PARTE|nr:uncharacterized protein GSPATT00010242001 [Paramecium tetraurelia]CAK74008.1 unnamed protein product [Paramecium tetraurelia]|eukprot:XP_001441405.1 hypothetical protein (macronuclear) [Paramecium tetraurelia strain d4-2]